MFLMPVSNMKTPSGGGGPSAPPMPVTSGLVHHVAADGPMTTDGNGVIQWTDISGNNTHWTAVGGAAGQPDVIPAAQNGLPVVRFDGAPSWPTLGNHMNQPAFRSGTQDGEIFIMLAQTRASGVTNAFWLFGASTAAPLYPFASPVWQVYDDWGSSVRYNFTGSAFATQNQFSMYNVTNGTGSPATWVARANGIQVHSAASTPSGWKTPSFYIGSNNAQGMGGGQNYFWKGDIGEIAIYNRQLSAGERTTVENHLRARWGTP